MGVHQTSSSPVSAAEVSVVLKAVLDSYVPDYDFEDRLKSLLGKLVKHGKQEEAVAFELAERLRKIPGMLQFFEKLTSKS